MKQDHQQELERISLLLTPDDKAAVERRATALGHKKPVDYLRSLLERDGLILTTPQRGGFRRERKKKA